MTTPIITLDVAGKELKFAPTMVAYNGFINDMMPSDKVAPAHNYLKKIVCQESKEALDELLKRPGAALQLAGAINQQFAPDLEITVKKLTARAEAIERNHLEQALALRRHYLPHDEDDIDSLARALWLDRHTRESYAAAVAEGIANAFNG